MSEVACQQLNMVHLANLRLADLRPDLAITQVARSARVAALAKLLSAPT